MRTWTRLFCLCSVWMLTVLTAAAAIAQESQEAVQGWKVWQQNCATRCHTGIQMPQLPDDPERIKTVIRHMRGIANLSGEWARALDKFLLEEEE